MNKDKLLTLFIGKCWHERTDNTQRYRRPSPCVCGKEYTTLSNLKNHFRIANPDFSQPAQWHEFLVWLCGKYENLWGEFYEYAHFNFCIDKSRAQYDAWLFSDLARFRDLFADFLCLPETIERWGWEECPEYGVVDGKSCIFICIKAQPCKNGKILVPWARYASEKPVQISDKKEATDEG